MRKIANIGVPTQPFSRATKLTGFTFKSYDKNSGVLRFEIKNQDGSPTDLLGATVRLFMYIYKGEEKQLFPIFDNQIITESYMQGIVKYPIPDMLLAYEGKVDAFIYIDFPDGSHTDNLAFTFNIEKSVIDGDVQLNGEYYFKDFQQLIDTMSQEIDTKIELVEEMVNDSKNQMGTVQQNINRVEEKVDEINQQIGELGKLKKIYSNNIDFGNYDYSGNANLLPKITAAHFTSGNGATVEDGPGGEIIFTLDGSAQLTKFNTSMRLPALQNGKRYTISAEIMLHEGLEGDASNIRLTNNYVPGGNIMLSTVRPSPTATNIWHTIRGTQIATYATTLPQQWYLVLQDVTASSRIKGKISLRNIKIEEGSVVTPYQPNLLFAPYQISRIALNENLANKEQAFPISSRQYLIYSAEMIEPFIANQTYTLTLKGTKLGTQSFRVYTTGPNSTCNIGDMEIVEGLADTWRLTFTPSEANLSGSVSPNTLQIYQFPQATMGQVTIDSLKIEKGGIATPDISEHKYFGEGLKDSNNPYDYSWDITPEHTEKGLKDKVSLTEPQAIEGTKDFLEQPYIEGERIATEKFGISLTGGLLSGVPIAEWTALNWGSIFAYDNERSKTNDVFTISQDTKTLTILKNCTLQLAGTFTCQTDNSNFYAYLIILVNGANRYRLAGVAGGLNWRNDIGWIATRQFKAGDVLTLVTSTNVKSESISAWGVDQVYIREVITA
ncbi:BppU family phage baseplate upper protein [Candidatus Enterococcus mangumiae]|uniref:BppU N-terminal domain-containing protein n=1 Tax=Candidatus Enterococcus mangumiae TaxID=2230878 RepID=A0ABZ2SX30_9ENTE|nr:BppU family phage baseplate upper protein [Enterococcus sp. DIV1094]